jgi:hypothetical protein
LRRRVPCVDHRDSIGRRRGSAPVGRVIAESDGGRPSRDAFQAIGVVKGIGDLGLCRPCRLAGSDGRSSSL